MQITTTFLLLLALIALVNVMDSCSSDTPPEYSRLFRLTKEQQAEEMRKYSVEKQIDVFVHATYTEPPSTQFVGFLASNGKSAIPFLIKRLKASDYDREKYYFIRVFREMHSDYYDLKDEGEVLETLKTIISGMRDKSYKMLSEDDLESILGEPQFGDSK
jgi:hypothetical protein